jgi:transcriptional regulator with XRE-family HTH domain
MSTSFPKCLRETLKNICERYDLSAAEPLQSLDAATIEAYESGELNPPLMVLLAYAEMAGVSADNLLDDDRDLWFGDRVN